MAMTMDQPVVIDVQHLSKSYLLYNNPSDRLKEFLVRGRKSYHRDFWALRDISFQVRKGSTVGIIGRNGSGKSTLLQIVAGTLQPTAGTVRTSGRIAALLELGAGFNPEFTGRENARMNAALVGYSSKEISERLAAIMHFAELGEFFDRPIKIYSSGMQIRLAFSISINIDPDILIVDEALAVGDIAFQHRCMRKFWELKARGVTVLLVSHSPETVKTLCDEAILLDHGRIATQGRAEDVVNAYLALIFGNRPLAAPVEALASVTQGSGRVLVEPSGTAVVEGWERSDGRYGNGAAEVIGIRTYDAAGNPTASFTHGSEMKVRVSAAFRQYVLAPILGITIRNDRGVDITRTNTYLEGLHLPPANPGDIYTVEFSMQLPYLYPGTYSISPAVANGTVYDYQMCDWIENALLIHVTSRYEVHGQMRFPGSITVFLTPRKYAASTIQHSN